VSTPFTVRLEQVFQGPLDLLLHLVREQEVEIHEIEINRVVQGYLEYLKAMKELDIELAGDFLVMAATLMSIKSRSLLPREEIDLEKELDPRDELIQRLIEYRRFKEASDQLGQRYALRELSFERGSAGQEEPAHEPVLELGELTSWDLLAAFSRLMRETLGHRPHRVARESRPLRYYVQTLARIMRERGALALSELVLALPEEPSRESLIGCFCALLELVKLGLVGVSQPELHGEIRVELKPEHAGDIEGMIESSVFDDEAPAPAEAETSPAAEAALEAPADQDQG
jgi:segregation and condensation protein A